MIRLFTTKTCKYCPAVKKFMDENDIKYEVMDCAEQKNKELLLDSGGRGVPAILTHAGTLVTGDEQIITYLKRNEIQI